MSPEHVVPKRSTKRAEDMDWLFANRAYLEEHHAGQWIAIEHGQLQGFGDTLDEALEAARLNGATDPLVTGVQSKEYQGMYLIRTCR